MKKIIIISIALLMINTTIFADIDKRNVIRLVGDIRLHAEDSGTYLTSLGANKTITAYLPQCNENTIGIYYKFKSDSFDYVDKNGNVRYFYILTYAKDVIKYSSSSSRYLVNKLGGNGPSSRVELICIMPHIWSIADTMSFGAVVNPGRNKQLRKLVNESKQYNQQSMPQQYQQSQQIPRPQIPQSQMQQYPYADDRH